MSGKTIRTVLWACALVLVLTTNTRRQEQNTVPAPRVQISFSQDDSPAAGDSGTALSITDTGRQSRHFGNNYRQLIPGLESFSYARGEYSRQRTDGGNGLLAIAAFCKSFSCPARILSGKRSDNSVFAHGSRFYINKFGALLI